jgi:hypothetical protein
MEDVRQELRRLRQRSWAQAQRREPLTGLSHWCLQTALLISTTLNYDFSAGADWLLLPRRRGLAVPTGMDKQRAVAELEQFFLGVDVDVLATWSDVQNNPLPLTVRNEADAFIRSHGLAVWIRGRNLAGAVVPTAAVIERYNSLAEVAVPGAMPRIAAALPILSAGRSWATRWRQKHGAKHMGMRTEDPMPVDEIRAKAADFFAARCSPQNRSGCKF